MAARHDYTYRPVHTHLNLLGWVSMMLFGLWYRLAPGAGETPLAKTHFWLYNLAFPVQMVALTSYVTGNTAIEPVLSLSSMVMGIAVLCFTLDLWKHTQN